MTNKLCGRSRAELDGLKEKIKAGKLDFADFFFNIAEKKGKVGKRETFAKIYGDDDDDDRCSDCGSKISDHIAAQQRIVPLGGGGAHVHRSLPGPLHQFDAEVSEAQLFCASSVPKFELNKVVNLPMYPGMNESKKAGDRLTISSDNKLVQGVLLRQTMLDTIDRVTQAGKNNRQFYLHGMHGTGKSLTLYGAALYWLHGDTMKRRLFYMGDCARWARLICAGEENDLTEAYTFLLRSLALCFCADEDILQQLQSCPLKGNKVRRLMEDIFTKMIQKKGLEMWVVFDQHNGIRDGLRGYFPFTLPQEDIPQWADFFENGRLIVSASANNKFKPLPNLGRVFPDGHPVSYTDDEMKAMMNTNDLKWEAKMGEVRCLTGLVPYQVHLLANAKTFAEFRSIQDKQVNADIDMWLRELEPHRQEQLQAAVFLMDAAIVVNTFDVVTVRLDERYMYTAEVGECLVVLRPLTPSIGRSLVTAIGAGEKSMEELARPLLQQEVDYGTKGRIIECLQSLPQGEKNL